MAKAITNTSNNEALASFGAQSVERRILNASQIKWDDAMKDKTVILQYLSRKAVTSSKNGTTYDVLTFRDSNGGIVAASFGVSTSSFETVQRGDVVSITYKGIRKLPTGVMNEFDIELIGHGNVE